VEAPTLKAVALISWPRISDGHLSELGTHSQRGDRIRYLTVATCPPFKGGEQSGVVAVTKPSVSGRRIRGSVKKSSTARAGLAPGPASRSERIFWSAMTFLRIVIPLHPLFEHDLRANSLRLPRMKTSTHFSGSRVSLDVACSVARSKCDISEP